MLIYCGMLPGEAADGLARRLVDAAMMALFGQRCRLFADRGLQGFHRTGDAGLADFRAAIVLAVAFRLRDVGRMQSAWRNRAGSLPCGARGAQQAAFFERFYLKHRPARLATGVPSTTSM
jgi:hypothetical protein